VLLDALRSAIDDSLRPLVPVAEPVALVGFPNHENVGDNAIWMGELAYLRSAGVDLAYRCDEFSYSRRRLTRALGHGTILLHGGGNFGDVWPQYEELREQVVADFPDNRIVQLPQSVHFKEPRNTARARDVFGRHGALTVLVRDSGSLQFAREELGVEARLCPDMAFAMGALKRPAAATEEVIYVLRTDPETAGVRAAFTELGVASIDWPLRSGGRKLLNRASMYGGALTARRPVPFGPLDRAVQKTYDRLARERLRVGREILSRGRVVVTDRLHVHILCLLLGIPHVCLDNSYGKLTAFITTWTESSPLVHRAASPRDAVDTARTLADASRVPVPG
jgi:exopolysaccharide biosynthesis predicted pyruvyltransferase EpsI